MSREEIIENLRKSVLSLLDSRGVELVDIELKPSRRRSLLIRFLVDKAYGISLDECVKLNGLISDLIDKQELIGQGYVLEVSSPGLDRPLKTKKDFERVKNKVINIIIRVDDKKMREITARVIEAKNDRVLIDINGEVESILLNEIQKATLKIGLRRV